MAPRYPSRPPIFSTNWDQRYDCYTCLTQDLDSDDDFNVKTWTCKVCGAPVLVHMVDEDRQYLVRRIPANKLVKRDYVYKGNDLSCLYEVKDSNKAQGKNQDWYLALENIGRLFVESDRYYNRIP